MKGPCEKKRLGGGSEATKKAELLGGRWDGIQRWLGGEAKEKRKKKRKGRAGRFQGSGKVNLDEEGCVLRYASDDSLPLF